MNKEKVFTNISGRISICILQIVVFLFIFTSSSFADNPIVTHVYTADPSGFVTNNRLYVVTSHDLNNQSGYDMYDYYLFSSADLVNWTDHGIIFDVNRDTSWANLAYAPDMAYKNGKYYLIFPNGATSIGVAVSDSPEGPFRDAIGRALIDKKTPNSNVQWCFDPGIFIDDDGQVYCYFGGGGPGNARVIKVNSNMTGVNGSAVTIDAPNFFEASYMHKRNGIYYFSYSTNTSAGLKIDYMTSSDPMTGFQYRGTVLDNPWSNLGNNNHHSIVEYNGQWYIFYHNRAVSNSVYQRSVCLDKLYYNSDGTIRKVNASQAGVGPVVTQPPGTPTPTPAPITLSPGSALTIQAEDVNISTGLVESIHSGYTGSGYVNYVNESGGYIEWTVTATEALQATCTFLFANGGDASRPCQLSVNGSNTVNEDFPASGAWTTWNSAAVTINLAGGSNTIRLTSSGSEGGPNVDRMDISASGSQTGSPGDVNNDGRVTIVDALMTAQYYVGLNPAGFNAANADVNCDGSITIVDALMIAQYYVGTIADLSC